MEKAQNGARQVSMMQGGTHTLDAVYTYLYHILPALFAGYQ